MSRFLDARHAGLKPYVPGEQPRGRKYIKLNTNESPYPPSPRVIEAISEAEVEALRLYCDPEATELRAAIARRYGLDAEQIVVGNGSDEILAFAFNAFCGARSVAFPAISYGFYPVFAGLYGVKARAVPLKEDFSIDVGDYLVPGENVVIANPNAPTGLTLSLAEIETILKAHPDDVVLIDEAYVDFGGESAVGLLGRYDNLLVVQTFSKSRSLAGARVGFGMGARELIADLQTMRNSYNPYNVTRLSQLAGAAAMRDEAYFRRCVERIVATRERTAAQLEALGCTLTQSRTNFLFVRFPGISGEAAQAGLRQEGILVRRFAQPRIEDYLRVSVGSEEDMAELVRVSEKIIREAQT